jgi:long-chain acyl-CoA synthetase
VFDSIPARFLAQARLRPAAPAYAIKRGGGWQTTPWRTYVAEVRAAARALIALGLEAGRDNVCILGFNRPEWTTLDLATMMVAGAPAGIYTTSSAEEVAYIVHHCEAPLVLVEDRGQYEKVARLRDRMPGLKWIVTMRGAPVIDDPMVLAWDEFVSRGAAVAESEVDARVERLRGDQLATLIYTSGTTGPPKGVMLSHANLAWTAEAARQMTGLDASASALSYLPLSHIAEQMFTLHGHATLGYCVSFAESIDRVADNLKEVQPHVFFGVPRIWEKMYSAIHSKLQDATGAKKAIATWARGVGAEASALRCQGRTPAGLLAVQYRLANRLVFHKLREAIGLSRAKVCVSGAAPIAREVIEFFASLDLVVHEVYGQSEDCGPTTFNMPGATRFGTVGRAVPGVEVRIAGDGEILVRGPNVFLGYYKDAAATSETLVDGWLHSGDLGSFDSAGFLSITGRKKEIIITSGGKNITPKNIEEAIKLHPAIGEAVVIGDRRKYLVALLTLDPDLAPRWASEHGVDVSNLHESPALRADLQRHLDGVNAEVSRVEGVKRFAVLPRPFSLEAGELTPTLKIKRRIVEKNWSAVIESLYGSDGE